MHKKQTLEHISYQMILHAGNARSSAIEAIRFAKEGNFNRAKEKITEAQQDFHQAHLVQTELLQKEANEKSQPPTILLIHAQDHLMTSQTVLELSIELIDLYKKIL